MHKSKFNPDQELLFKLQHQWKFRLKIKSQLIAGLKLFLLCFDKMDLMNNEES